MPAVFDVPIIDAEICELLPVHTHEERKTLHRNLTRDGCRDPLVVWDEENILLDGHNRLEICEADDIPYTIVRISLASRDDAIQWVIQQQLGRRNLTDEQRDYYIGKEYLTKKKAHGGDRKGTGGSSYQNDNLIRTEKDVAASHGISTSTVHRNATFAAAVDKISDQEGPDAKAEILAGKSGKTKAAVIREAVLCDRCKRVGSQQNCPQCAEARAAKPKKKKAKKKTPKPRDTIKDKVGTVVPDQCRDAFADTGLPDLITDLENVEAMFNVDAWLKRSMKLTDHFGFILIDKFNEHVVEALHRVQLAAEALRAGLPHAVCPKCEAVKTEDKICKGCRGYGHVPSHRYAELTK